MDFDEEEPTQMELNPNPALHTGGGDGGGDGSDGGGGGGGGFAEMVMIFAAGGVVRDGRGTSEWVNGVCPHARY